MTWAASGAYVAAMLGLAYSSYRSPTYEFDPPWLFTAASSTGVLAIIVWRGREIASRDYWLPVTLIAIACASYPSTSRDPFHYLFDGELIRLWRASPYAQPPSAFPLDQYSRVFQNTYWFHLPSPYGPLWQAVMASINWLSRNQLAGGMALLKALNAAALITCAAYVRAITGRAWLGFSLLINPLMLINSVHTPHTDVVLAALLLAAYHHSAPTRRGSLIAFAALIKPHVLVLAPFLERRYRRLLVMVATAASAASVLLLMLEPLIRSGPLQILHADIHTQYAAGPSYSFLLGHVFRHSDNLTVILASYGLFAVVYAAGYVAYAARRISSLQALALSGCLVPLLLYGLVYPWHFMIPLAMLSLSESPIAAEIGLFITVLAFRAPVNVLKMLLAAGAAVLIHCAANRISPAPRLVTWWNTVAAERPE